jgi:hypothetical protein
VRILIILEDPTLDQYVVKPIVEKLLEHIELTARVDVLQDPHLRGVEDALDPEILREIVEENPMVDAFVLVVDRDCNRTNNETRVRHREVEMGNKLIGCLAREEVEVWMLGLLPRNALPAPWREIRAECDPKQRYAEPFLAAQGWSTDVGRGRKRAMDALRGDLRRLLTRCDELVELQNRLANTSAG